MASTLDNVSNGRLELGIGAGWLRDEHLAFGFGWNRHSERIERLREGVEIIRKLWTENHVSYDGKHFRLRDATLEPKPLQKPTPTIWVGGNSSAITRVVAELGDGWIPVLPTPKQLANGVLEISDMMKAVGRDPQRLRVAYGGSGCALIAENEEQVKKLSEPLIRSMEKPEEESACLIGTPAQCIEKIEQYQKAGAQKIVAGFYDFPSLKGLRLFAKSVIPHFK
jgi:alkanesulfonate monooxygenase SsuD/methylene tetrahydromethanopterin reductase-like flavin-dependent oxidoreductase (luciferase family)